MKNRNRNILISCLVLVLTACLILSCISIGSGMLWLNQTTQGETAQNEAIPQTQSVIPTPKMENQAPTPADTEPAEPSPNPEESPANPPEDASISPEIARQMDEIQMQVVTERGLKPNAVVDRKLYTPEQLRAKIIRDFEEDYSPEDARTDARVLAAFGLLNPDFDIYNFYIDLLAEQVGGYYDQETKEMVVVQGAEFGGVERMTYAHEYTHALQDQNYDIENGLNYNDDACDADPERCAAVQALIEGDATLSGLNWFTEHATQEDYDSMMEFYDSFQSPVYDSAPDFIALDFTFPYEYGLAFVQSLYNTGGWGSVDLTYQNLPQSTEQIIHPSRYPDDTPLPVTLPDFAALLGSGWEEIDRGTMGEWYTYLILAKGLDEKARLDEETAASATEGWGGDAYAVYYNAQSGQTMMVLHTVWDTEAEADEFAAAFRAYADARFDSSAPDVWAGPDGIHTFHQSDAATTWILAPDAETAEAVWESVP